MEIPSLSGPRLLLRPWRDEDLESFVALSADPEVMRHYPAPLSRAESLASWGRLHAHFAAHRFGPWAVELPGTPEPLGFVGIMRPHFTAHFTSPERPCVELLWRLHRAFWGHGYASEAARLATAHAFEVVGVNELVAFTVPANSRSRAVMHRLGMTHDPRDDFDHPGLPAGHPLQRHVLYRLSRSRFQAQENGSTPR